VAAADARQDTAGGLDIVDAAPQELAANLTLTHR